MGPVDDSSALVAATNWIEQALTGSAATILATIALASYLAASRLLPMALFGILGYVEHALLVVFSVTLLGETLSARQIGTYAPIWVAVAVTAVHSVLLLREQRKDRVG